VGGSKESRHGVGGRRRRRISQTLHERVPRSERAGFKREYQKGPDGNSSRGHNNAIHGRVAFSIMDSAKKVGGRKEPADRFLTENVRRKIEIRKAKKRTIAGAGGSAARKGGERR